MHRAETVLPLFFHYLDERAYPRLLHLLADDCLWSRQGQLIRGKNEAEQVLASRPPGMRTRHATSNLLVLARDEALLGEVGARVSRLRKAEGLADEEADVWCSLYLTAYRHDEHVPTAPPWHIESPHKVSVVKARLRDIEGDLRIAELWMIEEFLFH